MAKKADIGREKELIVRAQGGDVMARAELHRVYKQLIDNIMYKSFSNYPGIPQARLRQEAENILDDALDKLNTKLLTQPSTFIVKTIENKLKRTALNEANPVRPTENYGYDVGRFEVAHKQLMDELGVNPTHTQIAMKMNEIEGTNKYNAKKVGRIAAIKRITTYATSNIGGSGDGELQAGEAIFIDKEDPMEDYGNKLLFQDMLSKLKMLPEPNRSVMMYLNGLEGYPKLSMRDTALRLGLSKYRIETIEKEETEKLRGEFGGI